MDIGQMLLFRLNKVLRKGIVTKVTSDDIEIKMNDGNSVRRKYWEVQKIKRDEEDKWKEIS